MKRPLPPIGSVSLVHDRLKRIFPEGFSQRTYCTREMAAKTVFTMLYIGAVEGAGVHLGPVQVVRMNNEQAGMLSDAERVDYAVASSKKKYVSRSTPWYEANTREPIRDETLRQGLIPCGAVVSLPGVPTTSSKGRYSLAPDFARLFDPSLEDPELEQAIQGWRRAHLSPSAMARMAIIQLAASKEGVEVRLPNGTGRLMGPGESSIISKGVIEEFAPRFLERPAVVSISESGNKRVHQDEVLARRINLNIEVTKVLPDIILADVAGDEVLLVFVEVVSTDGPINDVRRAELMSLAASGGYQENNVAFVTAFLERGAAPLRRTLGSLAWNSFVWLASEPDGLIALIERGSADQRTLRQLLVPRTPA